MNACRILLSVGLVFLTAGSAHGQCPASSSRPGGRFALIGRVLNAADNTDVSFVTLRLQGSTQQQMAVSDAQGRFVFQCLEATTYTVEASKRGFETTTELFSLINSGINDGVIYMRPLGEAVAKPKGATLSARDAQVPPKARKLFDDGMNKLYSQTEPDPRSSIADFSKAIALHPEYDEAYVQMGIAHGRLAQVKEAEEAFRKAISVYQQNGPAHSFLGKLLSEQGRVEEAVSELWKAIGIDDTNWLAHLDLARILAKQGKKEEAYEQARRAHELNTTVEDVHVAYYNACASLGLYAEALAELDEVVKLYPNSETAKKLLTIRPKLAAETGAKAP